MIFQCCLNLRAKSVLWRAWL